MYIIKGFKKNSGTLKNGKPWDNYTLFCLKEENGVTGYAVQAVKVPTRILQDTFPDVPHLSTLQSKSTMKSELTADRIRLLL